MRLTKASKSQIADELVDNLRRKRTEVITTLPSLHDELALQEHRLAGKLWKEKYGKYPFKSVPDEVIKKQNYLLIEIDNRSSSFIRLQYGFSRPSMSRLVIQLSQEEWESKAEKYLEVKKFKSKVDDELKELRSKVLGVLAGITTSKRLEKEWPEAYELLPPEDKGTGLINVTDIKDINRKLGLG